MNAIQHEKDYEKLVLGVYSTWTENARPHFKLRISVCCTLLSSSDWPKYRK